MQAAKKIAVAGATGRVGRHVVDVLGAAGHDVVPISRSNGVDVVTGEGLEQALTGVEVVIDVATGPSPEQEAATRFFTTATRNLQEVGERAGVRQIVVVSIIGLDRLTRRAYNAAKLAHEEAMLAGPIPVRVLRASQFHEFIGQVVDWGRQGEVSYVPSWRVQPVAARAVAETIAGLIAEPGVAASPFAEVAGPREENFAELAVRLVARRGDPVKIEAVSDPSDPDTELVESGALLPGPHATLAGPTFEDWLNAIS
jgi:uncharacterized protein YbjT (DUF2867 family)